MFRHVVMFRWSENAAPDHAVRVSSALDRLRQAIPQIRNYCFGPDQRLSEGNFDFVVVADFATQEDYLVYRDHPAHQEFIGAFIRDHVAARTAVQYQHGG